MAIFSAGSASVPIVPDFAGFQKTVDAYFARQSDVHVTVKPDLSNTDVARTEAELNAMHGTANVEVDRNALQSSIVGAIETAMSTSGLQALGGILTAAIAPTVVTAIGGAFVELAAAASQAVGVIALVPAGIAAIATPAAVVALGIQGMGAAFKALDSGNVTKINAAMANLAPSAQAVVTQIHALGPAFTAMRLDVQQALFAGVGNAVTSLASVALPILDTGLTKVATSMNSGLLATMNALQGVGPLFANTFTNIASSIQIAGNAAQPLVQAFATLTSVGSQFLPVLAQGFVNVATAFNTWVQHIAESGQLVVIIQNAINVIKELAALAINVGSVVAGIFTAALPFGNLLLTLLVDLTGKLATFVHSADGQTALASFFSSVNSALQSILPPLASVVEAIVTAVLPAIGQFAAALGPIAGQLLTQLASVLIQVGAILPPVAQVMGALAAAMSPLIPIIGQIITTLLPPLIKLAGDLAPIISQLSQMIGTALLSAVNAIAPLLPVVAKAFTDILNALLPLVPPLLQLAVSLIPPLVKALSDLIPTVANVIIQLVPFLDNLIKLTSAVVLPLIVNLITSFAAGAKVLLEVLGPFAPILEAIAIAIGVWTAAQTLLDIALDANPISLIIIAIAALVVAIGEIVTHLSVVKAAWSDFMTIIKADWDAFTADIAAVWNTSIAAVEARWNTFVANLKTGWDNFTANWNAFWGAIISFFETTWNSIFAFGQSIWNSIVAFFSAGWTAYTAAWGGFWTSIFSFFQTIWNTIFTTAQSIWNTLFAFYSAAWAAFQVAWDLFWNTTFSFFQNLWNSLFAWAQNLWNTLATWYSAQWAAFTTNWDNFWNTIFSFFQNLWNSLLAWAQNLWNTLATWYSAQWAAFTTNWDNFWNTIFSFFQNLWNTMFAFAQSIWTSLVTWYSAQWASFVSNWDSFWSSVGTAFTNAWNAIFSTGQSIWNSISGFFTSALAAFGSAWNSFWGTVSTDFSNVWNGILGFATQVWNSIKSVVATPVAFLINSVLNPLFNGWDAVNDFLKLPFHITPITPIPGFSEGGFTGMTGLYGTGSTDDPAGIVHAGEFVFTAAQVDKAGGPHALYAAASQLDNGYADGGFVRLLPGYAAGGMTYQPMEQWIAANIANAIITSDLRPGAADYHGSGNAVDFSFAGNPQSLLMPAADKVAASWHGITELIHNPNQSIKNGAVVPASFWGAPTWAAHANHVHWAMTAAALAAGGGGGVSGVGTGAATAAPTSISILGNIISSAGDVLSMLTNTITDPVKQLVGKFGDSPWVTILSKMPETILGGLWGLVKDQVGSAVSAAISSLGVSFATTAGTPASKQANVLTVQKDAATHGWGSGQEWSDLVNVLNFESGFNNTAQNPTSTAYGMYQFLDSTWATVGGTKTSDPALQALYGDRYIAQVYGDPIKAWAHEQQFHWYDQGGWLPPGYSTVYNGTGGFEAVLNQAQQASIGNAINGRNGDMPPVWHFYLGDREITDLVDARVTHWSNTDARHIRSGM